MLAQIKIAHAFRRTDRVRELASILVNLPLREARLIGQCYLAWCECRARNYQPVTLERIIDQTRVYKAQALFSRAVIDLYQGNFDEALRFYSEALKARPTVSEYALAVRAIAAIKSIEGFSRQALRDLSNLLPILRYTEPFVYFDCLNSYAVELGKAGQLHDAQNISKRVIASPFAPAYPEWQETFTDIASKRKRQSAIGIVHCCSVCGCTTQVEVPQNLLRKARVRTVIDFMNANLHRKLESADLAGVVKLSYSHFSTLFKAETGSSPIDYLIKLRIQKAAHLLATTSLIIKEIWTRVGFETASNFRRHFQKHFHASPTEYRRQVYADKADNVLHFPAGEKPSFNKIRPRQMYGAVLRIILKNRVTEEEIERASNIYHDALRDCGFKIVEILA